MYSFHRLLQVGAGMALCLLGAGTAVMAQPSVARDATYRAPQPASAAQERSAHVQRLPWRAEQRPPLPASRDHLYASYDTGALDRHAPLSIQAAARKNVTAACDTSVFASSSGAALVNAVRAADTSCINSLFSITGTAAAQTFAEAKMVTIANAMQTDAATYPGNNTAGMLQLVLFLRAGLYVQYYDSADVGNYGTPFYSAIRPALDAFVANAHFTDVNDAHGAVLSEFVILIDSSAENAHQLNTVRGILDRYGPTWAASYNMVASVNGVFTVLFRGHYNSDFQTLVQGSGSGVLDTLVNFINNNKAADLGTGREYLLQNASGELARFLQYSAEPYHSTTVHPKVKGILQQFALSGPGAGLYVRIGEVADGLDHAHCSYFGLCTFAQDLETQILPAANARDCSPTLRVRSQALTPAQLDIVCSTVGGEEGYFHTVAQTNNVPVADDHNTRLEMVIFHSSTDYENYSGVIFGNDTNNGGIYLEGAPSNVSTQPRFLAYEAEWLRPDFQVWNLTHEYIHYLDGRFNWHGGFGDLPQAAPYSAIWYVEGFAEFMSFSYRNVVDDRAITSSANPNTWTMSQLFDTEYSTDYDRTYQWGYMATRFMFERHRDLITSLYAVSRPGNYNPGYHNWLDPIRNSFNTEFHDWVVCYHANNGDTSSCGGPPGDHLFANGFEGDGTPPDQGECPLGNNNDTAPLDNNCTRSNIAQANAGNYSYFWIHVPSGATHLKFESTGGTGNADMYVSATTWADAAHADATSLNADNTETVTIDSPVGNTYYYVSLKATAPFSGVTLRAVYTP